MSSISFNNSAAFLFNGVASPEGVPVDIAKLVEEILESPGLSGKRWRALGYQHEVFQFITISAAASMVSAVALKRSMLLAFQASRTCRLIITIPSFTYTFLNVKIDACRPTPRPGQIVDAANGGSAGDASVLTEWAMQFTNFPLVAEA